MPEILFPRIIDSPELIRTATTAPRELVSCILHQASKGVLGGASKTNKTWLMLDLAVSVAYGLPWLGFPTTQAPVLFLNLEIQSHFFARRIADIARAKGITTLRDNVLHTWNLRGFAESFDTLIPKIISFTREKGYALLIIDPIYKILGSADENKATDIAGLLNKLESICTQVGCAVQYAAHFPKGNMAERSSIDRISGSGVFARDPDTIMTVIQHKEPNHFVVDLTLRNFKPIDPFVIRWEAPLMLRVEGMDPGDLKEPRSGRKEIYKDEELLSLLPSSGFCNTDWAQAAREHLDMSKSTFNKRLKQLDEEGLVEKIDGIWCPVSLGAIIENSKNGKSHLNGSVARS